MNFFLKPQAALRLSLLMASLVLAGCSLTPEFERPTLALPAQWGQAGVSDRTAADLPWKDFVRDPALQGLIAQALTHNRDLRVATLNIAQAQAQFQIRRADQFPTVNAGVTGSRVTTAQDQPIKASYTGGLTVPLSPSWELDLFGRVASLKDAALSQYLASEQTRHAVQTSLVAAVAQAWFNLQASEALLQLTAQTLSTRADGLRLTQLRYDQGVASALDLSAAQSLSAAARAALAQQDRQKQLDRHALSLLVGLAPGESLSLPLRSDAVLQTGQQVLAEVPLGLPSTVLLQRPDVQAAEWQLKAANAQIGAARAAFFPRISLTSSVGSASSELSALFRAGSWGWAVAPQALVPIFDAGRNQASLDAARVGRDIAVAQYEKAIQTAFREVNDALAGRATLDAQLAAQQALLQAETERARLTDLRFAQGMAGQLEVLDAQRSLYAAQQADIQTRAAWLQNRVALFKALGGGAQPAQ
ncbi:MAG: efflux transporter outer membrane subunit [Limnohabitans sp.]